MKAIRNSVFETNSSSIHSLSILNLKGIERPKGQILIVIPQEYGRRYDKLTTPEEKISYLFSLIASYSGFYWYSEEEGIEFTDEEFFSLPDVQRIFEAVSKHDSKIIFKRGADGFGHVDHQSVISMEELLDYNEIDLEDFIFNDKYQIIIDSD